MYDNIKKYLKKAQNYIGLGLFVKFLFLFFVSEIFYIFSTYLIIKFYPENNLRLFFFSIFLILCSFLFLFTIFSINKNRKNYKFTAEYLEKEFPILNKELETYIDLYEYDKEYRESFSNIIIERIGKNSLEKLNNIDYKKLIHFDRMRKETILFSFLSIFMLLFFIFDYESMRKSIYYSFMINENIPEMPKPYILWEKKEYDVLSGSNIETYVVFKNFKKSKNLKIFENKNNTGWYKSDEFIDFTSDTLKIKKENILDNYKIYIYDRKNKVYSDTIDIKIHLRPIVNNITYTISHPPYTKLSDINYSGTNGNIETVEGAKIDGYIETNNKLNYGEIVFSDSSKIKLYPIDNKKYKFTFFAKESKDYYFNLIDTLDIVSEKNITYHIEVKKDQFPFIEILEPQQDEFQIDDKNQVNFKLHILDDYGFSKLKLYYTINNKVVREKVIKNNFSFADEWIDYIWQISEDEFHADEELSYYFEIYDNDMINGFKKSTSKTMKIKKLSIFETFKEVLREQNKDIDKLDKAIDEQKKVKDKTEELKREILKDRKIDWKKKEEIKKNLDEQEKIVKKMDDLAKDIEKKKEMLEKEKAVSLEILEKMEKIQKLLQEVANDEMIKKMEEMRKALEKLDDKAIMEAMKNMNITQEDYLKRLERTLKLLENMKKEMKLEEFAKKTEELIDMQNEITKNIQNKKLTSEELKNKQDNVKEKFDQLMNAMENDNTLDEEQKEQLKNILEEMKNHKTSENMEKLSKQLGSNQRGSNEMQMSESIMNQMAQMSVNLNTMKMMMKNNMAMEILNSIDYAIIHFLNMSEKQKKLIKDSRFRRDLEPDKNIDSLLQEQLYIKNDLTGVLDSLYRISQKAFVFSRELEESFGNVIQNINFLTERIEKDKYFNPYMVSQQAANSMYLVSRELYKLKQKLLDKMSQQSGGGSGSMQQQMQQLSQQQMGINQQTQNMLNQMQNGAGMSMEQQAALKRLAAEQRAAREALEKLMEQAGNNNMQESGLLGRMEEIKKDMENSEKSLEEGRIDRNLRNIQDRILTRMLYSQKSINEKEFSDKRESNVGKDIKRNSPDSIKEIELSELQKEYIKILKGNYPKAYKEAMEAYYKRIIEYELLKKQSKD